MRKKWTIPEAVQQSSCASIRWFTCSRKVKVLALLTIHTSPQGWVCTIKSTHQIEPRLTPRSIKVDSDGNPFFFYPKLSILDSVSQSVSSSQENKSRSLLMKLPLKSIWSSFSSSISWLSDIWASIITLFVMWGASGLSNIDAGSSSYLSTLFTLRMLVLFRGRLEATFATDDFSKQAQDIKQSLLSIKTTRLEARCFNLSMQTGFEATLCMTDRSLISSQRIWEVS